MTRSGFTTIEMVIVMILVGIIAMIGFPKIRTALDKTNVRSARVSISSFAAEARAAAAQRGCRAVVHFIAGATSRAWVTACPRCSDESTPTRADQTWPLSHHSGPPAAPGGSWPRAISRTGAPKRLRSSADRTARRQTAAIGETPSRRAPRRGRSRCRCRREARRGRQ